MAIRFSLKKTPAALLGPGCNSPKGGEGFLQSGRCGFTCDGAILLQNFYRLVSETRDAL